MTKHSSQTSRRNSTSKRRRGVHLEKWWTKGVTSIDVGRRLRIVPRWEMHACSNDRVNVVIDPGPAFGVGDHPSTVMALELLEIAVQDLLRRKDAPTVLDVGTGTGVLAIAAKSLGAGFTVALDIDLVSIFTICPRNLELNKGDWNAAAPGPLCFLVGDVSAVTGCFDIVMANLAAPVLLRLRDALASHAAGWLILSGIADEMREEVVQAFSVGMEPFSRMSRMGWNALLMRTA
ncbi:MAG: 50S ribosomal protein L11 methyltransferase [Desulfomonilaceae bacterium]